LARFPDTLLFDLDGTLVDSVPDITLAVGELMAGEGLAPFPEAEVRDMVGYGVATLVERAFAARGIPLTAAEKTIRLTRMMEIYPRHLVDRSRLMAGATEALDYLRGGGFKLAVVTNKPQAAAETVLQHFGIDGFFGLILGDRPLDAHRLAPKPRPDMLLFALEFLQSRPDTAIMVGDSAADVQSAAAAAVFSIAVRNGYSVEPIDSFNPGLSIASLVDLPAAVAGLT